MRTHIFSTAHLRVRFGSPIPSRIIWVSLLASAALFSISLAAQSVEQTKAGYRFPLMTWFVAYAEGAKTAHYEVSTTLDLPAIWLYSPTGKLATKFTIDNEAALDQLVKKLPPADGPALTKAPTLDELNATFAKAGASIQRPTTGSAKVWTAVLFLSDSPACEHCGSFDRRIGAVQKKQPAQLDIVRVTLTD